MRLDFAYATRSVLYVMAAIMAAAAVVAFVGLRAGLQEETDVVAAESMPPAESGGEVGADPEAPALA